MEAAIAAPLRGFVAMFQLREPKRGGQGLWACPRWADSHWVLVETALLDNISQEIGWGISLNVALSPVSC